MAAALTLYMHPLSSYCWKALIALYEVGAEFECEVLQGRPADDAAFRAMWPLAKMPVLKDAAQDKVVPEASIIVEYLQSLYPNGPRLIPQSADRALDVRLWDRVFDLHVQSPLQKIVSDYLRPEGDRDPAGVADARAALGVAYEFLETGVAAQGARDGFTLADCAAVPALVYARAIRPFEPGQTELAAYFDRLLLRPSVQRTIREAKPFLQWFPFHQGLDPRVLSGEF
ncbi:glutathione S-transferase family protein [Phenylobacterium montanum]|uniref:Glutathione S-transferase family protein n=1 Tax=Phenylobacterium montanum TaxID=2823693 RepID=A0A975G057_9CAUL|nr:glutathione S-transferase family protein [Caulobacter sp. S6]QUD88354.1 glutathione S-transferase family protein [Caulobacter sp. S6]